MTQITHVNQKSISLSSQSKKSQILASALLGITVLMAVGFAPIEVIHNATHDTRHSTGFPCH
ncbi:MAG: CbtB-domain containing protein [Methylococcales bacterium]|nr:CbtB-domain containing protein [Methylococcales bacterium]